MTRTLSPTLNVLTDWLRGIRKRNMSFFAVLTISVGSSTEVLIPVTTASRSSGGVGEAAGRAINGGAGVGRAAGAEPKPRPELLTAWQPDVEPERAFWYSRS